MRRLVLALASALPLASAATGAQPHASLQLSRIIGDGMVMQRDAHVPVWGSAAPHARVVVAFDGRDYAATADAAGRWVATLPAMPAGGPHAMTVAADGERVEVRDILVGDVWVCSGQSNMEFVVRDAVNGAAEAAAAHDPQLRHFKVPTSYAWSPSDSLVGGAWAPADPQHAGQFTAVGYFFARELRKSVGVPIGLLHTSWGGSRIEAWTSAEGLGLDERAIARLEADERAYEARTLDSLRGRGGAVTAGVPDGQHINKIPTLLYNQMVHPLLPFPVKGVLWYQGESNADRYEDAVAYRALFAGMIRDWRRRWALGDVPFLWAQLPNYMPPDTAPALHSNWATLRESQAAALALPNTGQAVTVDVGETDNIHPRDKQDVGARLALVARRLVYGQAVEASGPVLRSSRFDGGQVVLGFDHAEGLTVRPRDHAPAVLGGFAVAGEDRKFVWAGARVEGGRVVVSSDRVPHPVAVRYAWGDNPDRANLSNAAGLPAAPFRTDRW